MTWIAPQVERSFDSFVGEERQMLEGWLNWHRGTLLAKCAGLAPAQLAQASVEPSNLTLLGLVRHMTIVERCWFRQRFAGEDIGDLYVTPEHADADFEDVATADAEADFDAFHEEIKACDAAVAGRGLDETFVHPRGDGQINLRWVYIHMIEEYARHNGHADLLRQRIDGTTGV